MIPKLENRKWKVLKSEKLLNRGTWMNLRVEQVQLPSGSIVPEWFILEFPDWVNVIAITKDGHFVMEDQYRHAIGQTHFELVAGVIDPGETPLEAAKRELSEETGYGGGEWSLFMQISTLPITPISAIPSLPQESRSSQSNIRSRQRIFMWISSQETRYASCSIQDR